MLTACFTHAVIISVERRAAKQKHTAAEQHTDFCNLYAEDFFVDAP